MVHVDPTKERVMELKFHPRKKEPWDIVNAIIGLTALFVLLFVESAAKYLLLAVFLVIYVLRKVE